MNEFFQDGPKLGNQFREDRTLQLHLRRLCPTDALEVMQPDLSAWGQRVVDEVAALGRDAEAHPPQLVPYDPWGRRIDQIETAAGWKEPFA